MKRTILFLFAVIAMVMGAKAQQQTATLQRGNSTTYYYGADAFKEAYNAANDGSVITLSAGYFNTVDSVMKQITIRGKGYTGEKTVIGNTKKVFGYPISLHVCTNNIALDGLYIEKGVILRNYSISNLYIRRCFLESFDCQPSAYHQNTIIENCKVGFVLSTQCANFCIKNSYVDWFSNTSNILCFNSIIGVYRDNLSYRNCIINVRNNNGQVTFESDQEFINNVFFCGVYTMDVSNLEIGWAATASIEESTRYSTPTLPDIETSNFKGNSVALFDDIFNYTNEENPLYAPIITTITGDDGTVVGPYGGTGFSENPTIPRITESKIDTYTDGEGKLNVKVKVEVGQ